MYRTFKRVFVHLWQKYAVQFEVYSQIYVAKPQNIVLVWLDDNYILWLCQKSGFFATFIFARGMV